MLDPPWCTKEQLANIQRERDKMHRALREYHEANGMNMEPGKVTHKNLQGAIEEVVKAARRGEEITLTLEMCTGTAVISPEEKKIPEKRLTPPGVHLASTQRISGELRSRYLDHLRELYAQEYIDLDELSARQDAMMISRTEEELKFLLRDLPPLPVTETVSVVEEKRRESASTVCALSAVCFLIISVLGLFMLHAGVGQTVFSLATIWAIIFGMLAAIRK